MKSLLSEKIRMDGLKNYKQKEEEEKEDKVRNRLQIEHQQA